MTAQAHLLGVQGEVDELLVLVAVADEEASGSCRWARAAISSGLAPGLQAVVVALAERGDLLDDLLAAG